MDTVTMVLIGGLAWLLIVITLLMILSSGSDRYHDEELSVSEDCD